MKVLVEIEFEKDIDERLIPAIPAIISNRDSVQMFGINIVNIRVVTKPRGEKQ